jgi:hypothetical protein
MSSVPSVTVPEHVLRFQILQIWTCGCKYIRMLRTADERPSCAELDAGLKKPELIKLTTEVQLRRSINNIRQQFLCNLYEVMCIRPYRVHRLQK